MSPWLHRSHKIEKKNHLQRISDLRYGNLVNLFMTIPERREGSANLIQLVAATADIEYTMDIDPLSTLCIPARGQSRTLQMGFVGFSPWNPQRKPPSTWLTCAAFPKDSAQNAQPAPCILRTRWNLAPSSSQAFWPQQHQNKRSVCRSTTAGRP